MWHTNYTWNTWKLGFWKRNFSKVQHKKNYCLFSVAYGEVNFKLIDGRKNSRSLKVEEDITLSKNKHNILLVPPVVCFCFTTKKKKSVIVNLINNPHSDKESIKSDNINGYRIKN